MIRLLTTDDVPAVVSLSLRAWEPVFASFAQVLGPRIYQAVYPDWRTAQAEAVAGVCAEMPETTWVSVTDGNPVGFIAVVLREARGPVITAEIEMLAVDPAHQRRGTATALIDFALARLRETGVTLVDVTTGGDPGHAPARRAYEKAGFTALPLVHYYRAL